jgi:sulfur carrier protein
VKTIIHFNGQPREVGDSTTVAMLLEQLNLRPAYVAVEINLELVPRAGHAQHVLRDGDRVEVVTLVGGG